MPRALTQGGDRPGGGHPRRNKDGDGRTSVRNALAVIRTATQPAQRRRLSPEPQVPRALIWRGRDGSPQVPRALTRRAAPRRPVPDDWQHTATPRDTPRKQPIPLPAPNIIKQEPVVFHKSSVGLNEGGQRLSATPLTSPTEPSPGLDIFPWMENTSGTAAEMDTGHIAQSSIQWAHHCPALCRQGRPNFLGQLSSCQLPTPFQHGGGGRHPTVWTKRGPRSTRAVWSSLHGSKAGPSGLH